MKAYVRMAKLFDGEMDEFGIPLRGKIVSVLINSCIKSDPEHIVTWRAR